MKQRFFIELAYDGTHYCGWQRQPNAPSVQAELEATLSKLHGGCDLPVLGCGRTDTGVHAHFFVAHCELNGDTDGNQLMYKLNKMLPRDIAIFRIYPVAADKHARFSATERTYRYFIHTQKSPFLKNSLYIPKPLDFEAMNRAAAFLLGKQDFTSLSKLHTDVKTNSCEVRAAAWKQDGQQWYFEISSDRFLRNMVRAAVGTLLEVGQGRISEQAIPAILAAKDRSAAKVSVDARGLFLWDVTYP